MRYNRPNILYVVCHDLGRTLGCYGKPVISPNLDRFASQGALFASAFCSSPACSPSRGCAMTGQYAHTNGLMGLVNQGWSLPESTRTIIDHLNDAGYTTAHVGLQHFFRPLDLESAGGAHLLALAAARAVLKVDHVTVLPPGFGYDADGLVTVYLDRADRDALVTLGTGKVIDHLILLLELYVEMPGLAGDLQQLGVVTVLHRAEGLERALGHVTADPAKVERQLGQRLILYLVHVGATVEQDELVPALTHGIRGPVAT